MASLNITKMKAGTLSGLKVHLDVTDRLSHQHSNQHINRELTHDNFCINCSSFEDGLKKIKQFIKNTDTMLPPKRIKKNRVTMAGIEFKIPPEITAQGCDREFSQKCIDYLSQRLNVPVAIGFGHVDERHTYIDPLTHEQKTSMNHVHCYVPAYTAEHGINGKHFFGIQNLNYAELNREFDSYVQREFGIQYMNSNEYLGLSVDTLKKISEKTEEHDNELKQELGIHQSIIDKGQMPAIETKPALGNNIKINEDEFAKLMKDVQYSNGAYNILVNQKKKIQELKKEIERINAKNKQRSEAMQRTYNQQLDVYDRSIRVFCEAYGRDYDSIINAINNSLAVGHQNDFRKVILGRNNRDNKDYIR